MKRLSCFLVMSLAIPASGQIGPGSGGPETGTPQNTGVVAIDGVTPEPASWRERGLYYIQGQTRESLALKWTTGINLIYDDGIVSRSELWEVYRFLRTLRPVPRVRYLQSWVRLKRSIGANTNPGVVSGLVATWSRTDPAAWLDSQSGRP
ncbi:hypothetical protein [Luteolibacter marinus]|uniref:hypothetical protein n=1 Tax=Luteolibacter marinus TaxID=2776705 RepID=UPI0018693797|nr:hypothetical protein [Luteolibacter marinus]